jgi:hypothetical protein
MPPLAAKDCQFLSLSRCNDRQGTHDQYWLLASWACRGVRHELAVAALLERDEPECCLGNSNQYWRSVTQRKTKSRPTSSIVLPTVSRPWFCRSAAFLLPRQAAMSLPSFSANTTPLKLSYSTWSSWKMQLSCDMVSSLRPSVQKVRPYMLWL